MKRLKMTCICHVLGWTMKKGELKRIKGQNEPEATGKGKEEGKRVDRRPAAVYLWKLI